MTELIVDKLQCFVKCFVFSGKTNNFVTYAMQCNRGDSVQPRGNSTFGNNLNTSVQPESGNYNFTDLL